MKTTKHITWAHLLYNKQEMKTALELILILHLLLIRATGKDQDVSVLGSDKTEGITQIMGVVPLIHKVTLKDKISIVRTVAAYYAWYHQQKVSQGQDCLWPIIYLVQSGYTMTFCMCN